MEFKKRRKNDIQLDITPIVDMVFILLIFFALSLNFTPASLLNINLPEASSKKIINEKKQVKIQITRKGEVFLNESRVNQNLLAGILSEIRLKSPESNIVIEADYSIAHGKVVMIMEICKKAGFNKISIAARFKNTR